MPKPFYSVRKWERERERTSKREREKESVHVYREGE